MLLFSYLCRAKIHVSVSLPSLQSFSLPEILRIFKIPWNIYWNDLTYSFTVVSPSRKEKKLMTDIWQGADILELVFCLTYSVIRGCYPAGKYQFKVNNKELEQNPWSLFFTFNKYLPTREKRIVRKFKWTFSIWRKWNGR